MEKAARGRQWILRFHASPLAKRSTREESPQHLQGPTGSDGLPPEVKCECGGAWLSQRTNGAQALWRFELNANVHVDHKPRS